MIGAILLLAPLLAGFAAQGAASAIPPGRFLWIGVWPNKVLVFDTAKDEVVQTIPPKVVAEPVPGRDPGDLREAPETTRPCLTRRHLVIVGRAGRAAYRGESRSSNLSRCSS